MYLPGTRCLELVGTNVVRILKIEKDVEMIAVDAVWILL